MTPEIAHTLFNRIANFGTKVLTQPHYTITKPRDNISPCFRDVNEAAQDFKLPDELKNQLGCYVIQCASLRFKHPNRILTLQDAKIITGLDLIIMREAFRQESTKPNLDQLYPSITYPGESTRFYAGIIGFRTRQLCTLKN